MEAAGDIGAGDEGQQGVVVTQLPEPEGLPDIGVEIHDSIITVERHHHSRAGVITVERASSPLSGVGHAGTAGHARRVLIRGGLTAVPALRGYSTAPAPAE